MEKKKFNIIPILVVCFIVLAGVFLVDVFKGGLIHKGPAQELYETPKQPINAYETTSGMLVIEEPAEDVLSDVSFSDASFSDVSFSEAS